MHEYPVILKVAPLVDVPPAMFPLLSTAIIPTQKINKIKYQHLLAYEFQNNNQMFTLL